MTDYYEVLGLSHSCTTEQVTHAYKALAKLTHPDMMADAPPAARKAAEERFKTVNLAHETLKDPERRAAYDQVAEAGPVYARRMALFVRKFEDAVAAIADAPYYFVHDPLPSMGRMLAEDYASASGQLMILQQRRGRVPHFRGRIVRHDGKPIPNDAFERGLHRMDRELEKEIGAVTERIEDCKWLLAQLPNYCWTADRPRVLPPLKASALRG